MQELLVDVSCLISLNLCRIVSEGGGRWVLCWEEGGCSAQVALLVCPLTSLIAFPSCLSESGCYWSWKCTLKRIFSLLQKGKCRGALLKRE